MIRMEKRLEEEQRRVTTCLHKTTEELLMKTLVRVMIEDKQETLLSECTQWFDNDMVCSLCTEAQRPAVQQTRLYTEAQQPAVQGWPCDSVAHRSTDQTAGNLTSRRRAPQAPPHQAQGQAGPKASAFGTHPHTRAQTRACNTPFCAQHVPLDGPSSLATWVGREVKLLHPGSLFVRAKVPAPENVMLFSRWTSRSACIAC